MAAIEGRLTVSESIAIASDVERASNENIVVDDDDLTARTIELDEDGNEIEPDINRTVISIRDEYRAAHGIIVPMGTTAVPADDGPNSSGSTSSNGKRKGNSFCGLRCRCDMRRTVLALNLINLVGCLWSILIREMLGGGHNGRFLPDTILAPDRGGHQVVMESVKQVSLGAILGIICTGIGLIGAIRLSRWMVWISIIWYTTLSILLLSLLLWLMSSSPQMDINPWFLLFTFLVMDWNLVSVYAHVGFLREHRNNMHNQRRRRYRSQRRRRRHRHVVDTDDSV